MTSLKRLKIKLDIKDETADELLGVLLSEAEEYILSYTKRTAKQWISAFNTIQIQIAVINYGRLGAEGLQGKTEGSISTTFFVSGNDYPDSVVKPLDSYRLIKGI